MTNGNNLGDNAYEAIVRSIREGIVDKRLAELSDVLYRRSQEIASPDSTLVKQVDTIVEQINAIAVEVREGGPRPRASKRAIELHSKVIKINGALQKAAPTPELKGAQERLVEATKRLLEDVFEV